MAGGLWLKKSASFLFRLNQTYQNTTVFTLVDTEDEQGIRGEEGVIFTNASSLIQSTIMSI